MSLKLHQRPAIEAGDPTQFSLRIEFVPNLDPGFAAPEEDLSWGRFQMWANGLNLCEHLDRGEVRRSVEWYLLPMLEWLAERWDFLLHEQRPPVTNAGETAWESLQRTDNPERFDRAMGWDVEADEANRAWRERHNLAACRAGGLFPDVVLRRWRHDVEISWGETGLAGAPAGFRFLHGTGALRVEPTLLAQTLYEVLKKTVTALTEEGASSERLLALAKRVTEIESAGRQGNRTAILAGLGSRVEEWTARWEKLRTKLQQKFAGKSDALKAWLEPAGGSLCVSGSCEAAVMFGSASPTLTEDDVFTVATHLVRSSESKPAAKWNALTVAPQPLARNESPWKAGYRLAEEWTQASGLEQKASGAVKVEEHLHKLGLPVAEISLDDAATAGLAVYPEHGAPHIFINKRNPKCKFPSGRRFAMAHELCHLIHDRVHGQSLAVISGPWAPRELEQRANAFAAALLMPRPALEKAVNGNRGNLDSKALFDLAKRFDVSTDALAHHLANTGLITEDTRDILLAQIGNRFASAGRKISNRRNAVK